MKIAAISDGHGYLPELEPSNLVLICGDMVPLDIQSNKKKTKKWYSIVFKDWAEDLQCDKVLFIPGNHELGMPGHKILYESMFPEDSKVTMIWDKEYIYTYNGIEYKIYGTPYCKMFGTWAFMYPDDVLESIYNKIPENLDILITHDAPYGVSDILLQKDSEWTNGEHIGNKPLAEIIKKRDPNYVFHGHLHSTSREFELLEKSKVINCSLLDDSYNQVYKPLYLDI